MKETFQLLAQYNLQVNAELIDILERLPAEQLTRETGSYYSSILGILNHLIAADATWMRRFADHYAKVAFLRQELEEVRFTSLAETIYHDLPSLKRTRSRMDAAIVRAFDLLEEELLGETLRYRNTKGIEQSKKAALVFLHFFNHQTHHRGQLSLLLDQLKVENDYSNLIWKF